MIRVVVADDQELVRQGLAMILAAQDDIDVVGQAADGVEAISLARQTHPDVVLMDLRMPRLDGIEATARILAALPNCRVLVLTTFDVDDTVLAAMRAGASGYLLKDAPRRSLLASVRAVAAGEVLLDHDIARRLIHTQPHPQDTARADRIRAKLTDREHQVLLAVADGRSNAEIAAQLGIGDATVKTHVARVLDKLDARDRVQLVVIAHTNGLVG
ncbi:MAG: response regulator transcription factor [Candidatus Nanopelagicales bacterium]